MFRSPLVANSGNQPLPNIDASERATPEALLSLLCKFIAERDLESIMAIHEEDAAMVEWGGGVARGHEAIREIYAEFFATEPDLKVSARQIIEADGVGHNPC